MSTEHENNDGRERVRVFVTGACEGLPKLQEALENHREIDLVGAADQPRDGAGALTGGHLGAVLHATRGSTLPADDLATIREYTRAPIILVASVESSSLLEEALEADVADVLLLPQLTENVVFAIRKVAHSGRRSKAAGSRKGRVVTVFSPKGGTGKTVTATNLAASVAKQHGKRTLLLDLDLQFGDAAIMLGMEPEKTIHDLVWPRASSTPRSSRATRRGTCRARHPRGAGAPGGRRARDRGEARSAARGGA